MLTVVIMPMDNVFSDNKHYKSAQYAITKSK